MGTWAALGKEQMSSFPTSSTKCLWFILALTKLYLLLPFCIPNSAAGFHRAPTKILWLFFVLFCSGFQVPGGCFFQLLISLILLFILILVCGFFWYNQAFPHFLPFSNPLLSHQDFWQVQSRQHVLWLVCASDLIMCTFHVKGTVYTHLFSLLL